MQETLTHGTMLIVDDMEMNREILTTCFEDKYAIIEAENGKEALEIIETCKGAIDVIVLDLSMPEMNGKEFLEYRKNNEKVNQIPVVIVTSSQRASDELEVFKLGIDDYIVKPFMPEVVEHRIRRVINNRRSFSSVLQEKNTFQLQAEIDTMTGLYNKSTTEMLIGEALENPNGQLYGFLMMDIDKFKKVNDTEGHLAGDEAVKEIGKLIASQFRKTDIVGRLGGDEFVVLMKDIPTKEVARNMAKRIVHLVKYKPNTKIPSYVSMSIGISFNECKPVSYVEIFEKADSALYKAKNNGRNQYQEYGREKIETQENDSVILFNASRTNSTIVEEALGESIRVMGTSDFRKLENILQEEQAFARAMFVDVSDEPDDGSSIWSIVEELKNIIHVPLVGIYQESNMKQCRQVLCHEASDIMSSPLDRTSLKRKMERILGKD